MALVLTEPATTLAAGTYLRIDGIRFDSAPRRRIDATWSVDLATSVRYHVYAYGSIASRAAGDAPITDHPCITTLAALGLLDPVAGSAALGLGPAWTVRDIDRDALWRALYRHLLCLYPRSICHDKGRCVL